MARLFLFHRTGHNNNNNINQAARSQQCRRSREFESTQRQLNPNNQNGIYAKRNGIQMQSPFSCVGFLPLFTAIRCLFRTEWNRFCGAIACAMNEWTEKKNAKQNRIKIITVIYAIQFFQHSHDSRSIHSTHLFYSIRCVTAPAPYHRRFNS